MDRFFNTTLNVIINTMHSTTYQSNINSHGQTTLSILWIKERKRRCPTNTTYIWGEVVRILHWRPKKTVELVNRWHGVIEGSKLVWVPYGVIKALWQPWCDLVVAYKSTGNHPPWDWIVARVFFLGMICSKFQRLRTPTSPTHRASPRFQLWALGRALNLVLKYEGACIDQSLVLVQSCLRVVSFYYLPNI